MEVRRMSSILCATPRPQVNCSSDADAGWEALRQRRQNCLKHVQNRKRPLFQREEDGLFTFNLMVSSELKAKQW
ncbi:hypothetical protein BS78_09G083900 [Paspalum vaginatum]|nr:hypothetical protein BS78_09G083900 [Paspalum vaginatum]